MSKTIETAQKQIESLNFNIRKRLLEYDDVLNKQREAIYGLRKRIILENLQEEIFEEFMNEVAERTAESFAQKGTIPEEWDYDGMVQHAMESLGIEITVEEIYSESLLDLKERLLKALKQRFELKKQELGDEVSREVMRFILLRTIDYWWREHLYDMDYLKEGINLRAYGQKDPLVEYKIEGYKLFENTLHMIQEQSLMFFYNVKVSQEITVRDETKAGRPTQGSSSSGRKVGRNEPCPCGSGLKYKKCCGRSA